MSCEILSLGRLKPCKGSVGGIKNIYFVNYGDFDGIVMNATDADVIDTLGTTVSAYKYDVHFSSSLTQNIQASAENGTVTSATALSNPFDGDVTVDNTPFINLPILGDVVTDTHYDDPNRKGRHVVFMSRMLNDHGVVAKGIACDEYTAVCIDENGMASVYGEHPDYDDYAYFLQVNCEYPFNSPETIEANTPLTWNMNGEALKVYFAPGTEDGSVQFDLNNWKEATGGSWQHWYVTNGTLIEHNGTQIDCGVEGIESLYLESNQIIGISDVLGRPAQFKKNEFLFVKYANGTIVKCMSTSY